MTWVRQSWRQPDQYVWLSEYLAGRGLQQFARSTIASITGVFAVVPILMLFSPSGPHGRVGTIAAITITVVCVAMAALWLIRWPSHNQSELFVLGCNLSVTIACMVAGTPVTGLLACTTFAPVAGYVALFEIENAQTVTVTAVRHQREEDYH